MVMHALKETFVIEEKNLSSRENRFLTALRKADIYIQTLMHVVHNKHTTC